MQHSYTLDSLQHHIPRYRNFQFDKMNPRQYIINSKNSSVSTYLPSQSNNNQLEFYQENNFNSTSRTSCQCMCHKHCMENILVNQKRDENYENKNNELLKEIVNLKKNLKLVKDELNKTRREKNESEFYIKELENEISKTNQVKKINGNKNDVEKYYHMLNKSFEILDSVSNKCMDPKGKIKGDVNYYLNKNTDYENIIDSQKNWLNQQLDNHDNLNEKEDSLINSKNNLKDSIFRDSIKSGKSPNENEKDNIDENNKEIEKNEKYRIEDKNGNEILNKGERLNVREISPFLGKNGEQELDKSGGLLFIGPDGEVKSVEDLKPIILDNGKPLVNEENIPYLGINGVVLVNSYGEPILGPSELYDNNNYVVQGEFGTIITVNQKKTTEKNVSTNTNKYNNINYEDKNLFNNKNNDTTISKIMEIKPLIGIDGLAVLDKNNQPIMLDKNNKVIKDPNIIILLNQNGKPICDKKGTPVLVDKKGELINLITIKNNNNYKNKKNYIDDTQKDKFKYPKFNPNYQRKNNFKRKKIIEYNEKEYNSSCFACNIGCGISRSGYSPMTFSPYNNYIKRREKTPIK